MTKRFCGDFMVVFSCTMMATCIQKYGQTLHKLDLSLNEIESDGAVALTKALTDHTCLQSLKLQANRFGFEGAVELGDMLAMNPPPLTDLHLFGNEIGDNGVLALARGLQNQSSCLALLENDGTRKKNPWDGKWRCEQDMHKSYRLSMADWLLRNRPDFAK
mmetsp:Transcript_26907/g.62517  ORF Transcript_26907/g.62517 Transcript_26907/m.62517 type:complete len:161 (-) Transcript_26907:1201-1683(-)